jgi:hypothetical protein
MKTIKDYTIENINRLLDQKNKLHLIQSTTENTNEYIRLGGKIEGINIAIENLRQQLTEIEHDNN